MLPPQSTTDENLMLEDGDNRPSSYHRNADYENESIEVDIKPVSLSRNNTVENKTRRYFNRNLL